MLPVGAPALNRDEALELLEQLKAELVECVCPPPNGRVDTAWNRNRLSERVLPVAYM
jgi:hypothetical protein